MKNKKAGRYTVLVISLVYGAAAMAQNLTFLRESPIAWLDDTDRGILNETIEALLASPDGTTTDWLNPESGSRGRIQVLDTHEAFGTTCRNLKMLNEAKGRKMGGVYNLCLSQDGQWRFAPDRDPDAKTPADASSTP